MISKICNIREQNIYSDFNWSKKYIFKLYRCLYYDNNKQINFANWFNWWNLYVYAFVVIWFRRRFSKTLACGQQKKWGKYIRFSFSCVCVCVFFFLIQVACHFFVLFVLIQKWCSKNKVFESGIKNPKGIPCTIWQQNGYFFVSFQYKFPNWISNFPRWINNCTMQRDVENVKIVSPFAPLV